jgi:hypothetical protein
VFQICGTTFYNQKYKIPMKIPEFKRSGIGIDSEQVSQPRGGARLLEEERALTFHHTVVQLLFMSTHTR